MNRFIYKSIHSDTNVMAFSVSGSDKQGNDVEFREFSRVDSDFRQ